MKAGIRYTPQVKDRAFSLYCEGKSTREIARALKVKRHETILAWIKKLGWEKRAARIRTEAVQKADKAAVIDIAARLKEHETAARALRGISLKALLNEQHADRPDPDALAAIGRALKTAVFLERQALGLPTEYSRQEHSGQLVVADARLDGITTDELRAAVSALARGNGSGRPNSRGRG